MISNVLRWCELNAGKTQIRFGSTQTDRQQVGGFTIGIMSMPDHAKFGEEGFVKMLAAWIRHDKVAIITCHFGKGNDKGIGETAVAACASVDHRIFPILNYSNVEEDMPRLTTDGGFIIFSDYQKVVDHNWSV